MRERMASPKSEGAVTRPQGAQQDMEHLLAGAALKGAQAVAKVRLGMVLLLILIPRSAVFLTGESLPIDPGRTVASSLFLLYSVWMLWRTRRAHPDPHRVLWGQVLQTLVDFSYLAFMGWRLLVAQGHIHTARTAVACALMMSFSLVSYSRMHVVLSTCLAVVTFSGTLVLSDTFSWVTASFAACCYVSLGWLILQTNRFVLETFPELEQRRRLSRLLPPTLVARVMREGTGVLAPAQREVTILFSDIRGFTTMSENKPPQAVLELLDRYLGLMAQVVREHGGMVNKFLGDGMLACWGVPTPSGTHAADAMRAALDMRRRLEEFNAPRAPEPPLRMGIGLHTGVVAAGMLGGSEQSEYTVIGDAVNVASRIEGLTKGLGVDILVSESTWQQGQGLFIGQRLAEEKVKGRAEAVVVYSLEGAVPSKTEAEQGPAQVLERSAS
jgi:adenylate cyclase